MWFITILRQDRNSPCLGAIVGIYCKTIQKVCYSSENLQVLLLFTLKCKITAATCTVLIAVVKAQQLLI